MASYGLRGVEPAEPDEITRGYFLRGRQLGGYIADRFAQQHGEEQIIREKPIPWPAGIAHGDVFVKPERLAVEVKSTASKVPLDYQLLQLAGQVEFDPEAERGALVLVNPSNLAVRALPMPVVTDELRERVHEIADAVAKAADPAAPLPERVCERPSDAIGRMCPFADVCFAGWVAPEPQEIADDVAHLAVELQAADAAVREAKKTVEEREGERDLIRAELRRTIEPRNEYVAGVDELVVRVTPVKGRVTYDVGTAVKMGAVEADALEPFKSVGAGYERWTVKTRPQLVEEQAPERVLAGLADVDYGPVPF